MKEVVDSLDKIYEHQKKVSRRGFWLKAVMGSVVIAFAVSRVLLGGDSVGNHIAVVDITGEISSNSISGSGRRIIKTFDSLRKEDVSHVVVFADSPGGSPSQAEMIYSAIKRFKEDTGIPVDVVVGDICASACVFLAMAGDKFLAHNTSLVGSIGVKIESYKVDIAARRLGVDKKIYQSDSTKGMLDMFSRDSSVVEEHIQKELVGVSYDYFKSVVLANRPIDESLLTGLIWTGIRAEELGLVDGIVDYGAYVERLKKIYAVEDVKIYNGKIRTFLDSLLQGVSENTFSMEAKI